MRDCCWAPSHGKNERWRAPDGHNTELWRCLNGRADTAVNTAEKMHWSEWSFEQQRLFTAERLALKALERMRDGSDALLQHLKHCSGDGDSDEKMVGTSR